MAVRRCDGCRGCCWPCSLLVAASFLIARNVADEGDDPGVDLQNDPSRSGELQDDPATDESGASPLGLGRVQKATAVSPS